MYFHIIKSEYQFLAIVILFYYYCYYCDLFIIKIVIDLSVEDLKKANQ